MHFACEILLVSVSGYYRWRKHPGRFGRFRRLRAIRPAIHAAYAASRQTYGSPRVHAALATLDVLQAQDANAQAHLRHAEAVVRFNQSQVNLLASLGLIGNGELLRCCVLRPRARELETD